MKYRVIGLILLFVVIVGGITIVSESQTAETATTVTPAPVLDDPTQTPSRVSPKELPPGVSPTGTIDAERLIRAHRQQLDGKSYTWTYIHIRTHRQSNERYVTRSRRVEVDETAMLVVSSGFLPPPENRTVYLTEQNGYQRTSVSEPEVINETRGDRSYVFTKNVELILSTVEYRVDFHERNGQQYTRLYASMRNNSQTAIESRTGNRSITAYITPEGLIQTLIIVYSDSNVQVSDRFEYSDVGETVVSRPDWVADLSKSTGAAPSRTPTFRQNTNHSGR